MTSVYVVSSLRNPKVQDVAAKLRGVGLDVYDDWASPGPETDTWWQEYEQARGRTFHEALEGWHALQVFEHDKRHLDRCDGVVLVLPAGKSAHLEFGYAIGSGKWGIILLDGEPERFDIMYRFANHVAYSVEDVVTLVEEYSEVPF